MRYGKITEGRLIMLPPVIRVGANIISHPTMEQAYALGYLPIYGEPAPAGGPFICWTEFFVQDGNVIYRKWQRQMKRVAVDRMQLSEIITQRGLASQLLETLRTNLNLFTWWTTDAAYTHGSDVTWLLCDALQISSQELLDILSESIEGGSK